MFLVKENLFTEIRILRIIIIRIIYEKEQISMNITNKIKIICEESYAETIWCKQLLGGLIKEMKKRRIAYEQTTYEENISQDDRVCIIGVSSVWFQKAIAKCNASEVVPLVLSNQSKCNVEAQYHLICPDMERVAKNLQMAFERAGRKKIALYGANYSADLDKDRTVIFSRLIKEPSDIYTNTGNLENCFRSFLPKAVRYDAVLCINGYAAVSLVKRLKKENPALLEELVIISFEEVLKHSKYNQWISLADLNLESYGAAAMPVLEMTDLQKDISVITIRMNAKMCGIPEKDAEGVSSHTEEHVLYEDPEIIHMAKIEQLLRDADDMDHHIIAMLLDNAKYSDIADSCYMTEGNVKYRVKKYMSTCDCKTKKELLELLQEYLQ